MLKGRQPIPSSSLLGMAEVHPGDAEGSIDPVPGEHNLIYLLGHPVSGSLSASFQNAALEAEGFAWRYVARSISPAELGIALHGLSTLGAVGANITAPYKKAALSWMDELDPEAAVVGAINTVRVHRGRLLGSNTDVDGFLEALRERCPTGLVRPAVLVLGTGGAARAAAWALVREGLVEEVMVVSRTPAKGEGLMNAILGEQKRRGQALSRFHVLQSPDALKAEQLQQLGLVVNATPVGSDPSEEQSPLSRLDGFGSDTLVFDMIYQVRPTPLLRLARAAGLPTEDGLAMLRYQGARSFQIWTGRPAPLETMKTALDRAVRAGEGA